MKFGVHNPSWIFGPDPADAFEGLKAKAQWAENHGFTWFSVMDHLIQIPPVGAPHEPFIEGWTALSALAEVTSRIRLATIAGGGEHLTWRVAARLADACNVFGDPAEVGRKFEILRRHCEALERPYEAIEKTNVISLLLARDETALPAKRASLGAAEPFRGFAGTVSRVIDLAGQYRDAGARLLISRAFKNDTETHELLAADVIPHFA